MSCVSLMLGYRITCRLRFATDLRQHQRKTFQRLLLRFFSEYLGKAL
jgi:hypothetical protein